MSVLKSILTTGLIASCMALGPVLPSNSNQAHAATSKWMKVVKIRGFMTRLAKTQQLPVSLKCKDDPNSRSAPLVQVRYRKNKPRVAWVWGWGNGVPKRNGPLLRAGYKRVSKTSYPSLIGHQECGLWHKPNPRKKNN